MRKIHKIIITLLLSAVLYLQSILSLLLYRFALSWGWLYLYMWLSAGAATLLLIYIILEVKFGND